ncbi:MAG: YtxH domain-containing protein [Candidatus Gracilibacteria bacterium]|nr:YtxH domain-containing protein [Candidatus Gracilibacteria bacterium]MDD5179130.1 YtxH domain-containing protein [Candidatus Gracilibacteria bacterium]
MKIFSKKTTFLVGSIVGSAIGMLFASESGKALRGKLLSAKNPQKKFEVFFQEYLRAGKGAIAEVKDSEVMKEVLAGGREIAEELRKRAKVEGSAAVKYAKEKADEVIREMEKQAGKNSKLARKTVKKAVAKTRSKINKVKKTVAKKVAVKRKPTAKKPVAKKKPTRRK